MASGLSKEDCVTRDRRTVSRWRARLHSSGVASSCEGISVIQSLEDHCKFVYRLNTGLSRLSAEKQRENFYKFSAVVYKLTAVSTG
jgi:hypothetical protein